MDALVTVEATMPDGNVTKKVSEVDNLPCGDAGVAFLKSYAAENVVARELSRQNLPPLGCGGDNADHTKICSIAIEQWSNKWAEYVDVIDKGVSSGPAYPPRFRVRLALSGGPGATMHAVQILVCLL